MEALEHGYTITAMLVGPDGSFVDRFSLAGVIMVDPRPDDPFVKQALSHAVAVIAEGGESHAIRSFDYRLHEGQHPVDGARDLLSGAHGDYDSVYCLNSTYGRAIATAAAELGVDIPGDLAVAVAAEEHEAAADPRLISLVLDPIESGAQSARTLIRLLEGGSPDDVLMPTKVLINGGAVQERRRSRATDPSAAGSRTPAGRTGTAAR
ncbi:MAG: substrate-binding domain-containing protein [Leucobacter sp.]